MGELGKTSLIRDIPYLNSVDFSDRNSMGIKACRHRAYIRDTQG